MVWHPTCASCRRNGGCGDYASWLRGDARWQADYHNEFVSRCRENALLHALWDEVELEAAGRPRSQASPPVLACTHVYTDMATNTIDVDRVEAIVEADAHPAHSDPGVALATAERSAFRPQRAVSQ